MVEEDCLNQLPICPANWYTRHKTAIGKTTPDAQNPNQAKASTFDEDDKMDGHCFLNLNNVNCLIYIKYTHFIPEKYIYYSQFHTYQYIQMQYWPAIWLILDQIHTIQCKIIYNNMALYNLETFLISFQNLSNLQEQRYTFKLQK